MRARQIVVAARRVVRDPAQALVVALVAALGVAALQAAADRPGAAVPAVLARVGHCPARVRVLSLRVPFFWLRPLSSFAAQCSAAVLPLRDEPSPLPVFALQPDAALAHQRLLLLLGFTFCLFFGRFCCRAA